MRLTLLVLILIVVMISVNPYEAGARPKEGDKTLNIGMTDFTYSSATEQECDDDGGNCEDTGTCKDWHLGVGMRGGYLLTDMIEGGLGFGLHRYSSKYESEDEWSYDSESSGWVLTGMGYGKLHLGSSEKTVPFIAGGLGLDLVWAKYKYEHYYYPMLSDDDDEVSSSEATFTLFAEGGIDYYLTDKYAINGSLRISRIGWAGDPDTDDDDNNIYAEGVWVIRVGFGLSTYF
jgi:hypothetical protein